MGKRRNLNDYLGGDRAEVRGAHFHAPVLWQDHGGHHAGGGFSYARCADKHPALMLPGTDKVVYGGSCSSPVVRDAMIYVGFDGGMRFTERNWPWKKGAEVLFVIPDMGIPAKPEEYRKLVNWVKNQIDAGHKVHCGCVGGHGRTGMFLAALVSLYGESDAIAYVRKNYCHKAVESTKQVAFLNSEYGVKKVAPSKSGHAGSAVTSLPSGKSSKSDRDGGKVETINPLAGRGSIWEAVCN